MARSRVPDWLAVGAGGAVGTAARALLDQVALAFPVGGLFLPWSTAAVNVVGAFGLGTVAAWVGGRLASGRGGAAELRQLKLLVGTGFTGAFTTYGTYIVASADHACRSGIAEAAAHSLALLALGGAAAWVGTCVGKRMCAPSAPGESGASRGEGA